MDIGIIGMGDMGQLYAKEFVDAGYNVCCCDVPKREEQLREQYKDSEIQVLHDGVAVSRKSDLIFYLVETENVAEVMKMYGPSTKDGAIISPGTSVMTPAIEACERYLSDDVSIIPWHWLFGSSVEPKGQTTVLVNHRSLEEEYKKARDVFESIGTNIIDLPSYEEHDKITADTQVVTHVGFESMGTAWKNAGFYPWENSSYVGGIDNVKILTCLRIYAGKDHVYSGLAMLNPSAKEQVKQYAESESELFKLMIKEDEKGLRNRLQSAADFIFENEDSPILLDDAVMGDFGLGLASEQRTPNSHLSLFAMADAWHQLGINPYKNLICQTPIFRLRLGIVEYLFKNPDLFEESVNTALYNKELRGDDLEFHTAVNTWASIIGNGDLAGYKNKFEETRAFFGEERLKEGMKESTELIKKLSG